MRLGANAVPQTRAQRFDLPLRQGCRYSVEANKLCHSRHLQHLQAVAQRQPHKDVARKQRQLQLHPPVLPAAHRLVHREKMLHRPHPELFRHALLVVGAGVRRVPKQFMETLERFRVSRATTHAHRCARHSSSHSHLQLRPVTYRAICDLTLLYSTYYSCLTTYSQLYSCLGAALSLSLTRRIQCQALPLTESPLSAFSPEPFSEMKPARAAMVEKTSFANSLRGSSASAPCHASLPKIQTAATVTAKIVPRKMIGSRGGKDLLSEMFAVSSTFTVGISFASWTFAISYSFVSVSRTAS